MSLRGCNVSRPAMSAGGWEGWKLDFLLSVIRIDKWAAAASYRSLHRAPLWSSHLKIPPPQTVNSSLSFWYVEATLSWIIVKK